MNLSSERTLSGYFFIAERNAKANVSDVCLVWEPTMCLCLWDTYSTHSSSQLLLNVSATRHFFFCVPSLLLFISQSVSVHNTTFFIQCFNECTSSTVYKRRWFRVCCIFFFSNSCLKCMLCASFSHSIPSLSSETKILLGLNFQVHNQSCSITSHNM